MKFDINKKIEMCVSDNQLRPVLQSVYLNVEDKKLVATDGRKMAQIDCEIEEGDTSGLIPIEAIKHYRKVNKKVNCYSMKCNGSCKITTSEGTIEFNRPDYQFPNYNNVIPKYEKMFKMSINAEYLLEIAKALGSDGKVTFNIPLKTDESGEIIDIDIKVPLTVDSNNSNTDDMGLLMQCIPQ